MRINALVREAALGERIAASVGVVSPCRSVHTLAWTVEAAKPRTQLLVRLAPCTRTASRRHQQHYSPYYAFFSLSFVLSLSLPYPRACPCSHGVSPLHFFCSHLASFSDGVYRGHYRADTLGQNLNRCYGHARYAEHPSCHAVNALVRQLHSRNALQFYIDTHGHATKRGCFLYGNCLAEHERMVENVLYAQLAAANCRWFDFGGCVFTKSFMSKADKRDGLSREGSARVAIYKKTDLTHVYTLESSYNTGRLINRLSPPRPQRQDKRAVRDISPPPPPRARACPSTHQRRARWARLAVSALDAEPAVSRLGAQGGGGLTRLRGVVGAWCRTEERRRPQALKAAFKRCRRELRAWCGADDDSRRWQRRRRRRRAGDARGGRGWAE